MPEGEKSLEQLYNQSLKTIREGEIIKGRITTITDNEVFVDVGFKSEGILPVEEFQESELKIGNELDFLVEAVENDAGIIALSREQAMQMQGWNQIVAGCQQGSLAQGRVIKKVKGGFLVSITGSEGFLPASLSGFRNMNEKEIINRSFKFKIVKINQFRRSFILSRREAIQKEREETKAHLWQELKIGETHSGTVKAITDFGAFIDLGGIDGLLHITDMSWSKISHPSETVAQGDQIEVVILGVDKEAGKVSLGLKQRLPDPWQDVETKFPAGTKVKGKVVNILNYGVFVELEKGIEGLIHISELSWAKRTVNPQETFAIGDIVEVQVLNIEKDARRISLSIKQLEANPWLEVESKYPPESRVTGRVRGFTDYGAFVELDANVEGMIHVSDMSWTKRINHPQDVLKKGQKVEVVVLSVDSQSRRISLGLKQVQPNPWPEIAQKYPIDTILETEVVNITDFGVFVKIDDDLEGLVFAGEIDKERLAGLKPGDKLKVKVIKVDVEQAKIGLSAKIE